LLVVGITLITSKILSPQYLIWILPFTALIFTRWRYLILIIFIIMGGLTFYIFPVHYLELLNRNFTAEIVLLARNILLIVLVVLAAISLKRMKVSE
jgi:hypothetical protein